MPPHVHRAAGSLRSALSDVSRMESRRKRKAEALRQVAKQDDISKKNYYTTYRMLTTTSDSVILAETARLERDFPMQKIEPAQFESLFEQRLERYDPDRQMVLDEEAEQKDLELQVQEANKAFLLARKGDSSTREREQALQRLETAYVKYKEIVSNLNTGRKFYNDLANIVNRFRDDCKQFAYQRRVEAGQWEHDLSNPMAGLSIQQTQQSLQEQKQRENARREYSAKAPAEEPLTAPTPTRAAGPPPPAVQQPQVGVWNPEIGIKFGGPAVNGAGPQRPAKGGQWDAGKGVKFS